MSHANELDQKLTSDLHKMIGTQYPNPKNTLRKRLAETALGRGVAKVRSGELQVTELEKAHQAYKRGDYRECCQLLNYAKSASAGSSGSTGSTGSSKPARSGGTDPEAQATGNHPGPEGVPVGSVTTLSDGTREQKIGPHEWRRMGDGKHDDAGKPDAQKKQEPEKTQPARPSLKAAQDELKRLRARRKATTSRELQTELDEQIGSLRKRIAKMKRGFDASDDAGAAQRRAHQGQTASRPARDKREDVQAKKQLAKSIRDISQAYTQSTASTEIPWYEAAERAAQQEFDAFISCFGTTDDALIALAKSSPHLMVHAKSIAHASGPNGLRSYIAAKVGG